MHFADSLGMSKREFYATIGVTRGTLESPTGITEEIMAKFIATYPNINLEWLVTGKGEMQKVPPPDLIVRPPVEQAADSKTMLEIISKQAATIQQLTTENSRLQNKLDEISGSGKEQEERWQDFGEVPRRL